MWAKVKKRFMKNLENQTVEVNSARVRVCFVCMGNICRSPTAEGVFRKLVEAQGLEDLIEIDSAGTHAYHVGSAPDARAQKAAGNRDVDLSILRGRQFGPNDFERFDYILVMDRSNLRDVLKQRQGDDDSRVALFLEFASHAKVDEVPDPYYGGASGFEFVLDLIEDASAGLLEDIRRNYLAG
jgi:protein-tyrosine phosphatase